MRNLCTALFVLCLIEAAVIVWLRLGRGQGTPPRPAEPPISRAPLRVSDVRPSGRYWAKWISENRARIESRAERILESWLESAENDRSQIDGAEVDVIDHAGPWLYVQLHKSHRKTPDSHGHDAYYHILLEPERLEVVLQQRGPDEIEMDVP